MVAFVSDRAVPALAGAVQQELKSSAYASVRRIDVDHEDGRILLRGEVRSFFLKQMVYVIASNAAAQHLLVDEVRVKP